ncbi:DNA-processing protein DprA [Oscillospiraceae bacterium PP1C4]
MVDSIFWIWLQEALGAGNIKVDKVIRQIGSPETVYHMSKSELAQTGFFAPKEIEKIKATNLEHARENQRLAKRYGCQIITPDHSNYPYNLTNIDCMPCVLYVVGDISGIDEELVITMVGTRSSTEYGETAAAKLAFDLSAAGCMIASGLAVGIDYASHEGALKANGRSIGLLACGMNVDYPTTSNELKRRILDCGGALITEFPFGEKAHRYHFNIRNRILSGIASGVVVVQAPDHSGALNTARHAMEQNREVFAVPGDIFDTSMTGCNQLIRDGAKIVVNVYSILEEFINQFPEKIDPKSVVSKIRQASGNIKKEHLVRIPRKVMRINADGTEQELLMVAQEAVKPLIKLDDSALDALSVSDAAKKIYRLLDRQPADCEWIASRTELTAMEMMTALTELELHELVNVLPGKRFTVQETK